MSKNTYSNKILTYKTYNNRLAKAILAHFNNNEDII